MCQILQSQVSSGVLPGVPGRDYPTNSLTGLRNRFPGIQLAPAELVTPDFHNGVKPGNVNINSGTFILDWKACF